MTKRSQFASLASAAALTLAISGATLAAAPTFTGTMTCTDPETGIVEVDLDVGSWTKKVINGNKRFWTKNGTCMQSWDWVVDVTKDA